MAGDAAARRGAAHLLGRLRLADVRPAPPNISGAVQQALQLLTSLNSTERGHSITIFLRLRTSGSLTMRAQSGMPLARQDQGAIDRRDFSHCRARGADTNHPLLSCSIGCGQDEFGHPVCLQGDTPLLHRDGMSRHQSLRRRRLPVHPGVEIEGRHTCRIKAGSNVRDNRIGGPHRGGERNHHGAPRQAAAHRAYQPSSRRRRAAVSRWRSWSPAKRNTRCCAPAST